MSLKQYALPKFAHATCFVFAEPYLFGRPEIGKMPNSLSYQFLLMLHEFTYHHSLGRKSDQLYQLYCEIKIHHRPSKIEWDRIIPDPEGSCDRAIRFSGLGVRLVGPVGDSLELDNIQCRPRQTSRRWKTVTHFALCLHTMCKGVAPVSSLGVSSRIT